MNTHKSQNKLKGGFTLIELLVVIAIIGILSAVVLASLNTARAKAQDAAIQSNLNGIRTQANLFYQSGNTYGSNVADSNSCSEPDTLFVDPTIVSQIAAADQANGPTTDVTCNIEAGGGAFAVSAGLIGTPGTYFCVDSTGIATTTVVALGATDFDCI